MVHSPGDAQQPHTEASPLDNIPGGGCNMKYVKDCTELYMGDMGLVGLHGFQALKNLEVLWINDNKLKYINHLENNFRIKALYAQGNCICTLKGSLQCFKFLQALDISRNQLRGLVKVVESLKKFNFLTHLNLQENPCCEELDYRARVIHEIPSLRVLDHRVITKEEIVHAESVFGHESVNVAIAFGKRVPPSAAKVEHGGLTISRLERDLHEEAVTIYGRTRRPASESQCREDVGKKVLPPPPGWGTGVSGGWGTDSMQIQIPKESPDGDSPQKSSRAKDTKGHQQLDTFTYLNCRSRRAEDFSLGEIAKDSIKLEASRYKEFLDRRKAADGWLLTRNTIVL